MKLSGWGNYPTAQTELCNFRDHSELRAIVAGRNRLIPRGNGRSYGDSSLAENVIDVRQHSLFIAFDDRTGLLHVQAGALLSDILDVFVRRGWFLPVSPGTKLVTVGGAIASDVHGKNHHIFGCFSECVDMLHIMLADGSVNRCSKTENSELFQATCGGMGLTGIILDARIALRRINSANILQRTIKCRNLEQTFEAFETYAHEPFSVAWIDCLVGGVDLGRSVLTVGDFADDGRLTYRTPRNLSVPRWYPSMLTNRLSAAIFNRIYYSKAGNRESVDTVELDTFFYPLDAINNWNRVYGDSGFVQYQFVLPKASSYDGLREVLTRVSQSGPGSYLAVIKLCGPANSNMLSFPMEGYSLAMDFKVVRGLFEFLDKLDRIVVKHGGRIYLAKDARVTKPVFENGYPRIEDFRSLRKEFSLERKFNSYQSIRLEI